MISNPMTGVYRRLSAEGFKKAYLKKFVLPDWWDDADALDNASFYSAILSISRRLGIDSDSLMDPSSAIIFNGSQAKFLKRQGTADSDLQTASVIAQSVARIALLGTPPQKGDIARQPEVLRSELMAGRRRSIDFRLLADYCWQMGVPVLHVTEFPANIKKMVGLALESDGRFAIVLTSNRQHGAWQVFPLAHEIGHIACGHLSSREMILDREQDMQDMEVPHEREANEYAMKLLTGRTQLWSRRPSFKFPSELADYATASAREYGIDPGVIVLQYGYESKDWKMASAAINAIGSSNDAPATIRTLTGQYLNWQEIPHASEQYIRALTGA